MTILATLTMPKPSKTNAAAATAATTTTTKRATKSTSNAGTQTKKSQPRKSPPLKNGSKKGTAATTTTTAPAAATTTTTTTTTAVLENGVDLRRVYTLPSRSNDSKEEKSPKSPSHHLDRFGFITNMDSHGNIHDVLEGDEITDKVPTFAEAARNDRRTKKWNVMMGSWNTTARRRRRLVVKRLRKGVPDQLRGRVWALLGDLPAQIEKHAGLYDRLVQQSAATEPPKTNAVAFKAIQETIERDIHRTYPRHAMFFTVEEEATDGNSITQESSAAADDENIGLCGTTEISTMIRDLECETKAAPVSNHGYTEEPSPTAILEQKGGQPSLRRVLKAYSLYDREIGYCQGMNFIVGMFLTFMSEEESFWLLVAVMYKEPCKMRGLFGEGMQETHKVLYVAEKLIHQFLPKVAKHLDKEHIHITMFATQWLLTQYTSSFHFDLVTRIWDCFLGEGWKITYRIMLAMLQQWQSSLIKMSFEDILAFFRELPERVDGAKTMEIAIKIPLRRKHIAKYEKEWLAQQTE